MTQIKAQRRSGWLIPANFSRIFHLPFAHDLMIKLLPTTIVVSYVIDGIKSNLARVFIHGRQNGLLFVAIALGARAGCVCSSPRQPMPYNRRGHCR